MNGALSRRDATCKYVLFQSESSEENRNNHRYFNKENLKREFVAQMIEALVKQRAVVQQPRD